VAGREKLPPSEILAVMGVQFEAVQRVQNFSMVKSLTELLLKRTFAL